MSTERPLLSGKNSVSMVSDSHGYFCCCHSWGHDFRPAYRRLSYLRTQHPKVPCLACTATATPHVIQDIQNILHLNKSPLLQGSFDRPNISYQVKYKDGMSRSSMGDPMTEMVTWIVEQHIQAKIQNKPCSGIVYVHKRDETTQIANAIVAKARQLQHRSLLAEPYHAGLNKTERNRILQEWSTDQVQVAVATIAFGMGIDLPHVRYVVHWSMAKTVEGFYQESGRAGRDGLPSHSLVYYSTSDVSKFQYLIRMQGENKKATSPSNKNWDPVERKLKALEQMVHYCTNMTCRRNFLLKHFGGKPVDCHKTCDYCKNPKKVQRTFQSASVAGDVFGRKVFNRNRASKRDPSLAYDTNHGLLVDDEDDEYRIAQDWGDGMVGDLKVTDTGKKYNSQWNGGGFVRASTLGGKKTKQVGFSKASDILNKFARMEERHHERYGVDENVRMRPATRVPIPEHFRTTTVPKKPLVPPKAAPTSQDHAKKASQLRDELAALQAEQERRMQALLAKRKNRT